MFAAVVNEPAELVIAVVAEFKTVVNAFEIKAEFEVIALATVCKLVPTPSAVPLKEAGTSFKADANSLIFAATPLRSVEPKVVTAPAMVLRPLAAEDKVLADVCAVENAFTPAARLESPVPIPSGIVTPDQAVTAPARLLRGSTISLIPPPANPLKVKALTPEAKR